MKQALIFSTLIIITLLALLLYEAEKEPIRIGILYSLTGTMASSEKPVMEATLLAFEKINLNGGLLGRKIEVTVQDGASDPAVFAEKAEYLIQEKKVVALFGIWSSACRKQVLPIVERHKSLLFYPLQHEGQELSPRIIYTGATPNQQITPAVSWVLQNIGSRVYLLGSDYIFPHIANWLIRKQVTLLGGEVVGERYIQLGSSDMQAVVHDLQTTQPDVIFNTINGSSLIPFFQAYATQWNAKSLPVMSFSLGENEIREMHLESVMNGNYAAWNYFQSISSKSNRAFIDAFQQRYGKDRVLSDPMEAAWVSVHLWADAVKAALSSKPDNVLASIRHRSVVAPEGIVSIDHHSLHSWKTVRIAQADADGQFQVLWQSPHAVRPEPFSLIISHQEAEQKMHMLYEQWGQQWIAP